MHDLLKNILSFFVLALLPFTFCQVHAQDSSTPALMDSIEISLLTCDPGPEVYALYGHMAIRYKNYQSGDDVVFNYGSFNMNTPFFILKFTLGMLDYELGAQPFEYFLRHYSGDGRKITGQVLNLNAGEKARLLSLIDDNYRPENRGYRYNFIYDNCATRPRDILEKSVDGTVIYETDSLQTTYRTMLHGFNHRWPWSELGVDLVLGAEADRTLTYRQHEFLPSYLLDHLNHAVIQDKDGNRKSVVKEVYVIEPMLPMDESPEFPFSPMTCALFLLCVSVILFVWEYLKKRVIWMADLFFFLAQGLAGLIIFVLFFFSEHPCTGSNWLILLFNPVPLIFLPRIVKRGIKGSADSYHVANLAFLTLFMIFFVVIPQEIPLVIVPLALVLWLRSLSHVLVCKKK